MGKDAKTQAPHFSPVISKFLYCNQTLYIYWQLNVSVEPYDTKPVQRYRY